MESVAISNVKTQWKERLDLFETLAKVEAILILRYLVSYSSKLSTLLYAVDLGGSCHG